MNSKLRATLFALATLLPPGLGIAYVEGGRGGLWPHGAALDWLAILGSSSVGALCVWLALSDRDRFERIALSLGFLLFWIVMTFGVMICYVCGRFRACM